MCKLTQTNAKANAEGRGGWIEKLKNINQASLRLSFPADYGQKNKLSSIIKVILINRILKLNLILTFLLFNWRPRCQF